MDQPPPELLGAAAPEQTTGKKRKAPAKPRAPRKPKAAADGAGGNDAAGQAAAAGGTTPPPAVKTKARASSGKGAGSGKARGAAAGRGGRGGQGSKGGKKGKGNQGDPKEILDLLYKEDAKPEEEPEEDVGPSHRDLFAKDLPNLMYGHGDSREPIKESVELLEDMAVEYVTDIVHKAMSLVHKRTTAAAAASASSKTKAEQLTLDDLLYVLRHDPRKYSRVREIVAMQDTIRAARKVVKTDVNEEMLAATVAAEGGEVAGDDMPHP
jgi:transcription initiation factor TFIID subunit 13